VDFIVQSPVQHLILTHGTDSLIETAQYLSVHLDQQVVVLTGAMRPERFSNSDASINLGLAIGAVQLLPKGVYIAMHGVVRTAQEARRDSESGQFI
ncbi:MAG: asparaginase domain-containing protein, partial [Bacteroidota bacterium]